MKKYDPEVSTNRRGAQEVNVLDEGWAEAEQLRLDTWIR